MNVFGITLDNTGLGLLGIAGTGIAWLVHHWLSVARERQSTFRVASSAFRAALNDELVALESKGGMTVSTRDLLLSAHLKHGAAVTEFRRYLFWRRRSFDKYWEQHHYGHGFDAKAFEIPEQDQLYLIYLGITEAEERTAKSLAIKNLYALLRFANET